MIEYCFNFGEQIFIEEDEDCFFESEPELEEVYEDAGTFYVYLAQRDDRRAKDLLANKMIKLGTLIHTYDVVTL